AGSVCHKVANNVATSNTPNAITNQSPISRECLIWLKNLRRDTFIDPGYPFGHLLADGNMPFTVNDHDMIDIQIMDNIFPFARIRDKYRFGYHIRCHPSLLSRRYQHSYGLNPLYRVAISWIDDVAIAFAVQLKIALVIS